METKILPQVTTQKVQKLLLSMNAQTEYKAGDFGFESNILAGLTTKNGSIVDSTCKLIPVKDIYEGRAKIETGRIRIDINPKNGEILQSKKPWFYTWKKAYSKIEKLIDLLQSNFENKNLVKKNFIGLNGVTQKGYEKLINAQIPIKRAIMKK